MTATATLNRFQMAFGAPSPRVRDKVVDRLSPFALEFIGQAPFVVLATADARGRCDASPKGGRPGFVQVLDERHLVLPDVRGNRLFQSYENVDANPHVGLIFFIPGLEHTVRVNGRARVVDADDLQARGMSLEVFDPDDEVALLQGLLVEVEEAYAHCPRALRFSRLWDEGVIEANRKAPPVRR